MKKTHSHRNRYSPLENPFLKKTEVCTDNQIIKTHITQQKLINSNTGEMISMFTTFVIEDDKESFIKIFASTIRTIFDLSRTGYRAFVLALQTYHANQDNHDASITFILHDGLINGKKMEMTDRAFYYGLKELTNKGILKPKSPNQYWVNSSLFFKGDKITFMKKHKKNKSSAKSVILSSEHQTDIEDFIK